MSPGTQYRHSQDILDGPLGMNVIHFGERFCSRLARGCKAFCSNVWPTADQSRMSRLHLPRHRLPDSRQPGLPVPWFGVVLAGALLLLGCADGKRASWAGSTPADGAVFAGEPGIRTVLIGWRLREDGSRGRVVCVEPPTDVLRASSILEIDAWRVLAGLTRSVSAVSPLLPTMELVRTGPFRACVAYQRGDISADEYRQVLNHYPNLVLAIAAVRKLARLEFLSETTHAIPELTDAVLDNAALGPMCLSQLLSPEVTQDDSEAARETRIYCADILHRQKRIRGFAALR